MLQNKIIIFISFFLWAFLLPAAGKLEVKEGEIQFGSFDANTPLAASYQIRNAGNSVIRIVGIRSTCSCAKTEYPESIQAGADGMIHLKIAANSYSGDFSGKLYILSNDPASPAELCFSGTAVPLFTVSPSPELYLGKIRSGTRIKKIFRIKGRRNFSLGTPVAMGKRQVELRVSTQNANELEAEVISEVHGKPGDRFSLFVDLPVISPSGWPPLKFRLSGCIQ